MEMSIVLQMLIKLSAVLATFNHSHFLKMFASFGFYESTSLGCFTFSLTIPTHSPLIISVPYVSNSCFTVGVGNSQLSNVFSFSSTLTLWFFLCHICNIEQCILLMFIFSSQITSPLNSRYLYLNYYSVYPFVYLNDISNLGYTKANPLLSSSYVRLLRQFVVISIPPFISHMKSFFMFQNK